MCCLLEFNLLEVTNGGIFSFLLSFSYEFRCALAMCFSQKSKALVWNWGQVYALKIITLAFKAPVSTNKVSLFRLTIKEHFEIG